MDIKTENNIKNNYRFKIINNENTYKIHLIILFLFTSTYFYALNKYNMLSILIEFNDKINILILFLLLFYLEFCYVTFNNLKINIKELYFTQDCKLYAKYLFLSKLKEIEFNLNDLYFRIESGLTLNNDIVIYDKTYNRLFKIRGSHGLSYEDLDKIAISFRNAKVKELKNTSFDKKTFKDDWGIIKTNYFSKEIFRNFWHV